MIISTTNTLDGLKVNQYLGIVNGEVILGANVFRDIAASFRNVVGGRVGSYEHVLGDARQQAIDAMVLQAEILGANAILGVDFDYEALGLNQGMLMVSASGTAVKV